MYRTLNILVAGLVLLLLPVVACASMQGEPFMDDGGFDINDLLDGTVSSLDATRTSPDAGGIHIEPAAGDWNGGNFQIDVAITNNGDGTLHYRYEVIVEDTPGIQAISHFTLDLSDDAFNFSSGSDKPESLADPLAFANALFNGAAADTSLGDAQKGPAMDEGVIKFNHDGEGETTYVAEFDSNRVPVFTHVWVKDGERGGNAANAAQYGAPDTEAINWFAAPDTVVVPGIPEPTTACVWIGLGLFGLASSFRKRGHNKQ